MGEEIFISWTTVIGLIIIVIVGLFIGLDFYEGIGWVNDNICSRWDRYEENIPFTCDANGMQDNSCEEIDTKENAKVERCSCVRDGEPSERICTYEFKGRSYSYSRDVINE
tara:strand:+ start:7716 stop:8048 length:333 start_codon:yes stop_codon:yes gene_type:complete